jgi:uncharacterized protein (TIGR04222 family)
MIWFNPDMSLLRRCAVALVVIFILAVPAALAQSDRSVTWERFDVDLTLLPGGALDVVETQRIYFNGTYRTGFREIPLSRVTGITDLSVEEEGRPYTRGSNQPYGYTVGRDNDRVRIDWAFPPTTNVARTFIVRYRAEGAMRVFDEADQIFWQAIYSDRPGRVEAGAVTVHLPSALSADQVLLEALPEAALLDARLADPRTARLTTGGLTPGTGFEVHVQIPHGLVQASPPPWQEREVWNERIKRRMQPILTFAFLLLGIAIPSIGGLWLLLTWFLRGRDPRVGRARGTLTSPPSDLPPGVVGTLVDERADVQDVLATMVDLGNRDILRIAPVHTEGSFEHKKDYRIRPTVNAQSDLRPYERTVYNALSRGADGALLSVLKQGFVRQIPLIRDQLHAEVARAGLFVSDPEKVRRRYLVIGVVMVVIGIVGMALSLRVAEGISPLLFLPFLTLIPVGVGALIMSRYMPRRTRRGAIEAAQWQAFARGLSAEGGQHGAVPTQRGEDSKLHHFLPYAIALGVDKKWLNRFNEIDVPAPSWFDLGDTPVIIGSPGYSGGHWGGGYAGQGSDWGRGGEGGSSGGAGPGLGFPDPQSASDAGVRSTQSASDFLADVLNAASEALSSAGSSSDSGGWSGGGDGSSGSGGGGGSGGFD